MAGSHISNAESLVRNAQHNARFGWIRLPIVIVVSGFVWLLCGPLYGATWLAAMIAVERISTHLRGKLAGGDLRFARAHLISLAALSALWMAFGVILWRSETEVGRTAATIGLLTTALYGALGGQKDIRPAAVLTAPPLLTLVGLISWHAWTHWSTTIAIVSSLATLGAGCAVLICARALVQSDATLVAANERLARMTQELAQSNTLLDQSAAIAHVGGWRLDLSDGTLQWTAETRRIHEVSADYVPTLATALDFYTPESRSLIESAVRRAAQNGVGWDLELQLVNARGIHKWVRASGQAETLDGAPMALTGAFMDITQRIHLESELRQAQKLEAIGRLTGGIAHDFNNVLTAILSSAELLEKSPEQRTATVANTIAKAASRAGDLTGKLLAFSRQQVLNPVVVDLNTAVQDAIELLRPLLVEEANIRTNFHATPLTTTLDLAQLTAAILNIALNARDAMPDGGSLEVSTHQGADNNVVLTLTDSGVGMSADVMDHMFDPFFTTKPEGVGLGLSMVHGFVTQSGGSIRVRSTPGQGTSFELSFPAAPADVSGNADKPTLHTAAEARILLVDDDPLVGDALSLTLSDHGFIVSTASDGPTAITHAGAHRFDFAVVDVTLTREMSGVELVKLLQRADPDLTAVLISGHAAAADIPAESTRTHFLQKPFKMETLLALLHRPGTEVARAS